MARRKTPAPRRTNPMVKNMAGLVVGGASGALVGGLLVQAGVAPTQAALGVTALGTVGTFTTTGVTKWVSGGMAATGAGQLALTWLAGLGQDDAEKALADARRAALANPAQARADMMSALDGARNALSGFDGDVDLVDDDSFVIAN